MLHYHTIAVTAFAQNCSILWCDQTMQGAVIDPGGDLDKLHAFIQQKGITLAQILITHGHVDHCAAAAELAEQHKLPIIGPHPDDQYWIDGLPTIASSYGFAPARSFTPARWLHDGDEVHIGQSTLHVRHTPGHTPGHVIFYSSEMQRAFVGDVLFAGSIGRTDFPGGDYDTLIASITQRLWPLGDNTIFIPGHGPESSFGHERQSNPYVAGT